MATLGLIILVIGFIVAAVAGIWLLVVAFHESTMWGLGCLFCNAVALIFVIIHWAEAKRPFLIQLGGVALIFLGTMLGGEVNFGDDDSAADSAEEADERRRFPENFTAEEGGTNTVATVIQETTNAAAVAASARTNRPATNRLAVTSGLTNRLAPNRQAMTTVRSNRLGSNYLAQARTTQRRTTTTTQSSSSLPSKEAETPMPPSAPVKTELPPQPLLLPGHNHPLEVQVTTIGGDDGTGLRPLTLRITNRTRKVPKQVRLTLVYLDVKRSRLKEWSTSVYDPQPPLKSNVTVELTQPAFFMPITTVSVVARVDSIRFDDGTEWSR